MSDQWAGTYADTIEHKDPSIIHLSGVPLPERGPSDRAAELLDALRPYLDGAGVPVEGAKVCQVPENTGLYSDEFACDGCGGLARAAINEPYPPWDAFRLCFDCLAVLRGEGCTLASYPV